MARGYNEKIVAAFFNSHGIPCPLFEYKFCAERNWRFDLAWPGGPHRRRSGAIETTVLVDGHLALEVQGGLFSGGGHTRGAALLKEYEKLNRAACLGWRILFVTPDQLCTSATALLLKESFGWL